MALTDEEQAREFEHNRKIQNDFIKKIEKIEKGKGQMATGYGKELQRLENENEELKKELRLSECQRIKESEVKIIYTLVPELKKKIKEFSKQRESDDKIWIKLKRYIEKISFNDSVSAELVIKKGEDLMKRF